MRWLYLLFAVIFALAIGCTPQSALLLEPEALAATTLTCSRPVGKNHQTIDSQTDWDIYTTQNWVNWLIVCNNHATASVYWGDPAETGTVNLASDHYTTIPAGTCWGEDPAQKRSAGARTVPLHSTTASHAVDFACYEERP